MDSNRDPSLLQLRASGRTRTLLLLWSALVAFDGIHLLVPSPAWAEPTPSPVTSWETRRPFEKGDLAEWSVEGVASYEYRDERKPNWNLVDGVLCCAGEGFGFLRYKEHLTDFRARFEFQLTPDCNSGVGIRTTPYDGTRETRPSSAGLELQILGSESQSNSEAKQNLSLYGHTGAAAPPTFEPGVWHAIEIECVGSKLSVVANDRTVHEVDLMTLGAADASPRSGYFCFQSHTGRIRFRRLEIAKPCDDGNPRLSRSSP